MPEGDSIFKVAARLRPALVGKPLSRLELREQGPLPSLVGHTVERIDVLGKHMFVYIEPRKVLHVHLGMNGRWRSFPSGATKRFPPASAVAILGTGDDAYVCFQAAFARLRPIDDPSVRRVLESLGPDLLDPAFDLDRAVRRSMAASERSVAEVITDQRSRSHARQPRPGQEEHHGHPQGRASPCWRRAPLGLSTPRRPVLAMQDADRAQHRGRHGAQHLLVSPLPARVTDPCVSADPPSRVVRTSAPCDVLGRGEWRRSCWQAVRGKPPSPVG